MTRLLNNGRRIPGVNSTFINSIDNDYPKLTLSYKIPSSFISFFWSGIRMYSGIILIPENLLCSFQ